MENPVLGSEEVLPESLRRSVERALRPRFTAYVSEARRLIRAGLAEIRERGTVEPRVADIVRRAGLSNKAFYRHFRSKEELLLAVLEEAMSRRLQEFEADMASEGTALGRVRRWVELVLEPAADPEMAATIRPLLVHQARLLEQLGEQVWSCVWRSRQPLEAALREAAGSGELPGIDPAREAEIVYTLAMGWMHGRVIAGRQSTPEESRAVANFAICGLQRAAASP